MMRSVSNASATGKLFLAIKRLLHKGGWMGTETWRPPKVHIPFQLLAMAANHPL